MNAISRYAFSGYFLMFAIWSFSPSIGFFINEIIITSRFNYTEIIAMLLGIPIGYLINLLSTYIYFNDRLINVFDNYHYEYLINKTIKKESEIYLIQLKNNKIGDEWLEWRWSHYTMSFNILLSILLGSILGWVIEISVKRSIPLLSVERQQCLIGLLLVIILLTYHINSLKYFLINYYSKMKGDEKRTKKKYQ